MQSLLSTPSEICLRLLWTWVKTTQLGLCVLCHCPRSDILPDLLFRMLTGALSTVSDHLSFRNWMSHFCKPPRNLGKLLLHALLLMFDRLEDPSMWWWEMKLALQSFPIFQPIFHPVKLESAGPPNACCHWAQLCRVSLCRPCIYVCLNKVPSIQTCMFLNEKICCCNSQNYFKLFITSQIHSVEGSRFVSPILKQWLWKL